MCLFDASSKRTLASCARISADVSKEVKCSELSRLNQDKHHSGGGYLELKRNHNQRYVSKRSRRSNEAATQMVLIDG